MSPFERPRPSVRRVEILHGDTPQRMAVRELRDFSRWVDIVSINNLLPPYFTGNLAEASSRVLAYGASVLVPDVGTQLVTPSADPTRTFGVDCLLANGDLTDESGDFAVVAGYPNLSQALRLRLETDPGQLLLHPEYGCGVRQLLGRGGTATNVSLASSLVRRAVTAEPRISEARNVTARLSGDSVRVTGTAVAVDASIVSVE